MSDITNTQDKVLVRSCPNPFTSGKIDYVFLHGLTIKQILENIKVPDHVSFLVAIGGVPVKPEDYANVIPAKGAQISIRAVPTGGGGDKNIFRTVLLVIVTVVAYVYAPPLGTALSAGLGVSAGVGLGLATMAIMTVGMLIVNAIAPPSTASLGGIGRLGGFSGGGISSGGSATGAAARPTYALSGANNALVPYGVIPMLLGRHRISPPYGARPYTVNEGDDQYLHCLFCIGYGLVFMIDHRFGETPVENFDDIEIEILNGDNSDNTDLFPSDVFQQDESIVLKESEGWATRETQPDTTRISVDVTYPNGLIELEDDGSTSRLEGLIDIQYRRAGTSDPWIGEIHTVDW